MFVFAGISAAARGGGLTGETVYNGSMRGTRYLLEQYVGLDKDMIFKIKRMPTRWCCVFKKTTHKRL